MTIPQNSDKRPLVWPLTLSGSDGSFTGDETDEFLNLIDWPSEDDSERVSVVMKISLQEFVALGNSIDVGSDIAYNGNSAYIWYVWLRALKSMTICDDVADCIETSEAVETAIANLIQSSSLVQNAISQVQNSSMAISPLSQNVIGTNIIPDGALCTEANKYAMARSIVQELDRLTTDMLEVIEFATSPSEIAAEYIAAIPIFGGAASLALETANWVQDEIQEAYAAAYNATTEVDFSCAVYCAFSNCDLSYDDIISAYLDQASFEPPSSNDFGVVIDWFLDNVVGSVDNIVVGAAHCLVLMCLKWGSDWFGSGIWTTIDIAIEDAKDEEITVPESCDCDPPEFCVVYDFEASASNWLAYDNGAGNCQTVYIASTGFRGSGDEPDRTIIYRTDGSGVELSEAKLYFNRTQPQSVNWFVHGDVVPSELAVDPANRISPHTTNSLGDGNYEAIFDLGGNNYDDMEFHLQASGAIGQFTIYKLELSGIGIAPSGGNDCE